MCVFLPSLHLSLLFSRLQSQNFSMVHSLLHGCHCEECLLYVWHLWPFRNWGFYSCGCCKSWNTPHWSKLSFYGLSFVQGKNSEPAWLYNLIPPGVFLTDLTTHKKRIRRESLVVTGTTVFVNWHFWCINVRGINCHTCLPTVSWDNLFFSFSDSKSHLYFLEKVCLEFLLNAWFELEKLVDIHLEDRHVSY